MESKCKGRSEQGSGERRVTGGSTRAEHCMAVRLPGLFMVFKELGTALGLKL